MTGPRYALYQRVRFGLAIAEVRGRTREEEPRYELLVGGERIREVPESEILPLSVDEVRREDVS